MTEFTKHIHQSMFQFHALCFFFFPLLPALIPDLVSSQPWTVTQNVSASSSATLAHPQPSTSMTGMDSEWHTDMLSWSISHMLNEFCTDWWRDCDCNRTPLMLAVLNGHTDCVYFLISKGANVGARDKWGRTALHRGVCCTYVIQLYKRFPCTCAYISPCDGELSVFTCSNNLNWKKSQMLATFPSCLVWQEENRAYGI